MCREAGCPPSTWCRGAVADLTVSQLHGTGNDPLDRGWVLDQLDHSQGVAETPVVPVPPSIFVPAWTDRPDTGSTDTLEVSAVTCNLDERDLRMPRIRVTHERREELCNLC